MCTTIISRSNYINNNYLPPDARPNSCGEPNGALINSELKIKTYSHCSLILSTFRKKPNRTMNGKVIENDHFGGLST